MIGKLCALAAAALVLVACGGGGGGSASTSPSPTPTPTPTPTPVATTNFVPVIVDGGPSSLSTPTNTIVEANVAYVSVTLCAPGSATNCQTIDHVQVDTGSIGLRIFQSVLNPSLLNALPFETDTGANPVGECYQYVDGYVFGSVRSTDFTIGGEQVAGMPFQVLSDTGQFSNPPATCSAGGGDNLGTVAEFGSNGIIGIGSTTTDCGTTCQNGGQSAAIYYDCPTAGCSAVIARNASATAPFQQLPNPVAAMGVDNNGTILVLPQTPPSGEASLSGTLYFGIGTESNNALGSATVYTITSSSSRDGPGLITAVYNGQTLPNSFLDSGSSLYFFEDSGIPLCSDPNFKGFYCPPTTLTLSPTIVGLNGARYNDVFSLFNAETVFNATPSFAVEPGVGANPNIIFPSTAYAGSFDFGLPFFYGRSVYTAIEGRQAGGTVGPYFAF
jgi:hypothetical protein